MRENNITVVGAGYVGLANAFLIGITEPVCLIDIDEEKINKMQAGIPAINDKYIADYIDKVNVEYTTSTEVAYSNANYIFVATNTDYDEELNKFNLNSVEGAIKDISKYAAEGTVIVIKSTIPIGYTDDLQARYPQFKFIFSPEFLRESFALEDNLYPDRIVVSNDDEDGQYVARLLRQNILKDVNEVPIVFTSNREAEVIKLFANTYLAMRVAYVNELDSFCQQSGLKTENVLDAIGYDHRIGRDYFNPSFGFGGYCLPKDTKQLKREFENAGVDSAIISNIPDANVKRKEFIASEIMKMVEDKENEVIGMYRIISKKGINNYRSSANTDIAILLKEAGYQVQIFEPNVEEESIFDIKVNNNIEQFKAECNVIVANRVDAEIADFAKVYTADVYNQY